MLIEQNIEFGLRGPGSSGRTSICTPKPGYFYEKYSWASLRVNYYLLQEVLL